MNVVIFEKFHYFAESCDFSRAEKFLMRLRFFVKEKYLRSRRAPSAYTKIPEFEKQ
jgi:hypothetical protein